MNNQQLATTLAALRYFQRNRSSALMAMSGHFQNVRPLADDAIDKLCEGINVGQPANRPQRPWIDMKLTKSLD